MYDFKPIDEKRNLCFKLSPTHVKLWVHHKDTDNVTSFPKLTLESFSNMLDILVSLEKEFKAQDVCNKRLKKFKQKLYE